MNTLSLLIYLAGVAGTLNGFLVFLATIFGILALVALGVWIFSFNNTDSNQRPFLNTFSRRIERMARRAGDGFGCSSCS